MECSKCGHKQAEGAFCGQCGGELIPQSEGTMENSSQENIESSQPTTNETAATSAADDQAAETTATTQETSQQSQGEQVTHESSEAMTRVIETSKEFGSFFQRFIKSPSIVFAEGSKQLINGIITLTLVALLFIIALYNLVNFDLSFGMGFDIYEGPSFLSVAGNGLLFIGVSMVFVIGIIFIINKLFGNHELSFGDVTAIYGVLMIPTSVVAAVALLLILLKSYIFGPLMLILTIGFTTSLIPIYIVNHLVITHRKTIDPIYAYIIFIFTSLIGLTIIYSMMADSIVGGILNEFLNFDPYGF